MVFVRLEGRAVEYGIGIMEQELLDDPPQGRSECDMAVHTSRHAGVKEGKPITIAVPDERARVTVVGEIARGLVVVVNDDFLGLETDVSADIALQSGVASEPQTSLGTILSNDVEGIPVVVQTVGLSKELARDSLAELEQTIGGELEPFAVGNVRPKLLFEFLSIIVIS